VRCRQCRIYGLIFVLSLYFQQVRIVPFATGLACGDDGAVLPVNLIAPVSPSASARRHDGGPAVLCQAVGCLAALGVEATQVTARSACN